MVGRGRTCGWVSCRRVGATVGGWGQPSLSCQVNVRKLNCFILSCQVNVRKLDCFILSCQVNVRKLDCFIDFHSKRLEMVPSVAYMDPCDCD